MSPLPRMKNIVWIAVVVAVLGGMAYPKLRPLWSDAKAQPEAGSKPKQEAPGKSERGAGSASKDAKPLQVTTYLVQPADFAETIAATGSVRADEGVELLPETNGKIVNINFDEGMPVKKGALLVKLNDADLRATLDRYVYTKQLAVLREQRQAALLKQQVVRQDDYDSALNDVHVQQSYIDLYKAEIEKTEIRAPFDGVVGLRYVSNGAFVNANTKIATLQRLDRLKIDFAIPEKYTGRVKVGGLITFSIAGGLKKFSGHISAIDPRIDSGTRTLLLRAVANNSDGALLPGAFASITLQLDTLPNAVLVPAQAVIPGLEEKNVFVMNEGVAERRAVETGSRTATQVHILSGLKAGDKVITSGLQQMRAGQGVVSLSDKSDQKNEAEKARKADAKPQSGAASVRTQRSTVPA